MAIIPREENTYLVRVYLGRDAITKKRVEINRTVHGTLASTKKVEAKLKGQKEFGDVVKTSMITLNRLLDRYLESVRHLQAESTRYKNKAFLNYYVRPYIGSMPLKRISTNHVQELFNFLLDKKKGEKGTARNEQGKGGMGLRPNTVKIVRAVLSAAFNYAIDEKLIGNNPVYKTKLPLVRDINANSLTIEEAKDFVSVKDTIWYGDAFVFQLHTGLRPQELLALVWEDIDFKQGTVRVERACKWIHGVFIGFGPTKTSKSDRTIALTSQHLELLRVHFDKQQKVIEERKANGKPYGEPKIEEWVMRERPKQAHLYASARLIFSKPDGSVPNIYVPRLEFKEMLRRAGIPDAQTKYRWYDLRHSHATFLLDLKIPVHEVAARMGHSVITLLTMYAHKLKHMESVAATSFIKLIPVKRHQTNPSPEKDLDPEANEESCPEADK